MALDWTILGLCAITTLSNCAYALIAPFMPLELAKKGVPLSLSGYIFRYYLTLIF